MPIPSNAAQQLGDLTPGPQPVSRDQISKASELLSSVPDRINKALYPASLGAIRDVANRAAINVLGAPVDAAAVLTNSAIAAGGLAGHKLGLLSTPPDLIHAPVGGSEWMGKQFEDARIVSPVRRPAAEFLATLAAPQVGTLGARAIGAASELSPAIAPSRGGPIVSAERQLGAISPEGKARLLADLQAGKGSGTYRLGDVTEGQARALTNLGTPPTVNRDVMMTDVGTQHLIDARMNRDGFQPEEIVRFAKQAIEPRSKAVRDPAASGHKSALANDGLLDMSTKQRYTAQMPLRSSGDNFEVVSVIPRGLPGRKTEAPE